MKKILLATDFSERSVRALRRATLLARRFAASLVIIHVVDDDQPRRIVGGERDAASALLGRPAETGALALRPKGRAWSSRHATRQPHRSDTPTASVQWTVGAAI